MLRISRSPTALCDGAARRTVLQCGAGTGLLGLTVPKLLAAEATGSKPTAKSVIFLFLFLAVQATRSTPT